MGNVEISKLDPHGAKLKGKTAAFAINPNGKSNDFNGLLFFADSALDPIEDDVVVITRPGEFEIGGAKIKADRFDDTCVFSLRIDGVSILVSPLSLLEKHHGKLQEHDLVLVDVDKSVDPSFVSSLGTNGVIYFGEFVGEFSKSFLKNENQQLPKFVTTREKLPQEMVTVTLQ